ncbi:HET domain-containing protein [Phlyctema vagabunda]|uniref:HET domain-containing protein n=1 Tax=Phlyctema vagabunda TaxID=108571 RepID=A0ABR4P639_9HELO
MTTPTSVQPDADTTAKTLCSACAYIREVLSCRETDPRVRYDDRSGWPHITLDLQTLRPNINDANFIREAFTKQQSIPWHMIDHHYFETKDKRCVIDRSLDRIAELWTLGLDNFLAGKFIENDRLGFFKDVYLMYSLTTGWSCELWPSDDIDKDSRSWQRTRGLLDMDYGALQTRKVMWFPARPIWPNPLHPRVVARIREWFWLCDESGWRHPCRTAKISMVLPSRLLEIESTRTRLVDTTTLDVPLRERYFALSHCWGSSQPFRTLRSNLEAHLLSINESALPQTFKDAIALARALDIRYVWIDSLCIVQDDEVDWRKEAALMADVYNNAYLTISAADALSDDEGFLHRRQSKTATVHVTLPNGKYTEFFIAPPWTQPKRYDEPIDTRAWTYQEGLLSHRILRFHRDEMTFDCLANTQTPNWRESRRGSEITQGPKSRFLLPDIISQIGTSENWSGWTSKIVGPFLERKLSFEKDRLPALAGLARRVAESLQDSSDGPMGKYLAGIFSSHMKTEGPISRGVVFFWRPLQPIAHALDQTYFVPSWSYLSAGGPVEFRPKEWISVGMRWPTSLVANHLELAGSDPFGPLKGGYIILHASVTLLRPEDELCSHELVYPFRARYWLDSSRNAPRNSLGIMMQFTDFGPRANGKVSSIGPASRGLLLEEVVYEQDVKMLLPTHIAEGAVLKDISTRSWRRIGLFETIPFDYKIWKEVLPYKVYEINIKLV